jgi:hypothetical protein
MKNSGALRSPGTLELCKCELEDARYAKKEIERKYLINKEENQQIVKS